MLSDKSGITKLDSIHLIVEINWWFNYMNYCTVIYGSSSFDFGTIGKDVTKYFKLKQTLSQNQATLSNQYN